MSFTLLHPRRLRLLLWTLALFGASSALAEQLKRFGDYDVHYIAMNTMDLAPDVAAEYGITRARNRALLNVSVRERTRGDRGDVARRARVSGQSLNLIGQITPLDFREVREERYLDADGNERWRAVYYLATVRFTDEDVLRFRLKVRPDGQPRTFDVRFQQKLYLE